MKDQLSKVIVKIQVIGTRTIAPEVMLNTKQSYPIDLWSLCVLIYVLKCKKMPFGDNEERCDYKKTSNEMRC